MLAETFGITLGGQLDITNPSVGAPSPKIVGDALGVDGLFYGILEEYNHIFLWYYEGRRVEVRFILVDSKTGSIVWDKEAEAYNTYSLNKIFNPMAQSLPGMILSRALGENPLKDETDDVMSKLGKTMPCGPGDVVRVK